MHHTRPVLLITMISVRLRSDKSQACSSQSIRLPSLDTAGADYRRAKHPRPMPMYARFLHLNQIRRLAHANACSLPFSLTSTSAVLPSCNRLLLQRGAAPLRADTGREYTDNAQPTGPLT